MCESLYIHIPYCISKCKYCDFFSVVCNNSDYSIPNEYIDALCNEIEYRLKKNHIKHLSTIYIGGGTPSLLSESQIERLFNTILTNSTINKETEISIEVNPDDVSKQLINMYCKSYINRISCGIQSLNDDALVFSGRRADSKTNYRALELFSKYWKKDLSIDIICGLPNETLLTFKNMLNKIVEYKPQHISMYSLTIEDDTPLGKMVNQGKIHFDYDFSDFLWIEGYKILKQNGYEQYEVSNFSLCNKSCRHNLVYWNHNDYIGCGASATGTIYNDDGSGIRWTNTKIINEYCAFWNENNIKNSNSIFVEEKKPEIIENLNIENSIFEFFMMGLRKRSGINTIDYTRIFGNDISKKIISLFEKWNEKKLVDIKKSENNVNYALNEKGILFLNSFLEELI